MGIPCWHTPCEIPGPLGTLSLLWAVLRPAYISVLTRFIFLPHGIYFSCQVFFYSIRGKVWDFTIAVTSVNMMKLYEEKANNVFPHFHSHFLPPLPPGQLLLFHTFLLPHANMHERYAHTQGSQLNKKILCYWLLLCEEHTHHHPHPPLSNLIWKIPFSSLQVLSIWEGRDEKTASNLGISKWSFGRYACKGGDAK